jgi:hypothetical protein
VLLNSSCGPPYAGSLLTDIGSCTNVELGPSDCPSPISAEATIVVAEKLIRRQLDTAVACERKPIAIYGGPATGKSTVMSLLFAKLKLIEDFRPIIVSLRKLSLYAAVGHNEAFTCWARKGLSPSDLIADMIARELMEDDADHMERVADWGSVERHIDSCTGQSGKFILLLDDLPCLECPLRASTEIFLRSFYAKSNRCLVFSSSFPMFSGIGDLPCVPTARVMYNANEHIERNLALDFKGADISDWYLCGGVPGLIYSNLRSPRAVAEKVHIAWNEMNALAPYRNVMWPPVQEFVKEIFEPTPFPPTMQYFTHLSGCLMSWGLQSYVYWPPLVVAEIMSVFEEDARCSELQKLAAEWIYDTVNLPPAQRKFSGVAREWECTVRVSMLLWTIRISDCTNILRVFLFNILGVNKLSSWGEDTHHHAVGLRELPLASCDLKRYLDEITHSALDGSITLFLSPNCGADESLEPLAEYSGIIGVRDDQGKVEYFGFLSDEQRARPQPEWIVRSSLILPPTAKPTADRIAALERSDWFIWTKDAVARFLGFSVTRLLGFPLHKNPGFYK